VTLTCTSPHSLLFTVKPVKLEPTKDTLHPVTIRFITVQNVLARDTEESENTQLTKTSSRVLDEGGHNYTAHAWIKYLVAFRQPT